MDKNKGLLLNNPPYFLGIDNGLTVVKAVIYTADGKEVGCGSVKGENTSIHPGWVERDLNLVWEWVCEAIKSVIETTGISPADIQAVGVTAHGDGLYLVDRNGIPIRDGIVSLDSRAQSEMDGWEQSNVFDKLLEIAGQVPLLASPVALLAWMKKYERSIYDKIGWVLSCKDWIRYKLSGEIYTDITEASASFTNVNTQLYDSKILKLLDLEEMEGRIPPVKAPIDLGGQVTGKAAVETGLCKGTRIAVGLHDIDACSIGAGCIKPGQGISIIGTWSINQVISDKPLRSLNWKCRNFISYGQWVNLAVSPASATNLEWFITNFCLDEYNKEKALDKSGYDFVEREIRSVLDKKSEVFFLPFLYGSPFGPKPSAGFIGLHGWHTRANLLKAIYEGVVFNHAYHIQQLQEGLPVSKVYLTGGGSNSELWCQLFADTINLPVLVPDVHEAGALGTAICAMVATGVYSSVQEAVEKITNVKRTYLPDPKSHVRLSEAYSNYINLCKTLLPYWSENE